MKLQKNWATVRKEIWVRQTAMDVLLSDDEQEVLGTVEYDLAANSNNRWNVNITVTLAGPDPQFQGGAMLPFKATVVQALLAVGTAVGLATADKVRAEQAKAEEERHERRMTCPDCSRHVLRCECGYGDEN